MIRHVIWDWNGTLLDDVDACVGALNVLLGRRGMPLIDQPRYLETFGFPVRKYYDRLGFRFEGDEWDLTAREYHQIYETLAVSAPLRHGAREVLEELRDRRVTMSVLSACEQSLLDRMMTERGIRGFFAAVRGLDNLHASSKLDLGRQLVANGGFPGNETLLVGDTIHDFDVARELGCRCLLLSAGHQAEHRLRSACACEIRGTMADVLRAVAPPGGQNQATS